MGIGLVDPDLGVARIWSIVVLVISVGNICHIDKRRITKRGLVVKGEWG